MVEPRQRVEESGNETARRARAAMGGCGSDDGQEEGGD
jgi:hypothetical protein